MAASEGWWSDTRGLAGVTRPTARGMGAPAQWDIYEAQRLQASINSLLQRGKIIGFQQLGGLAVDIRQVAYQLVDVVSNSAILLVFLQTAGGGEALDTNLL